MLPLLPNSSEKPSISTSWTTSEANLSLKYYKKDSWDSAVFFVPRTGLAYLNAVYLLLKSSGFVTNNQNPSQKSAKIGNF